MQKANCLFDKQKIYDKFQAFAYATNIDYSTNFYNIFIK